MCGDPGGQRRLQPQQAGRGPEGPITIGSWIRSVVASTISTFTVQCYFCVLSSRFVAVEVSSQIARHHVGPPETRLQGPRHAFNGGGTQALGRIVCLQLSAMLRGVSQ